MFRRRRDGRPDKDGDLGDSGDSGDSREHAELAEPGDHVDGDHVSGDRTQDTPRPGYRDTTGEADGDGVELARGGADPSSGVGPWDAASAPPDEVVRLDLGSMLVPGLPGVEIQLNVDEASGTVIAVTAVHGESALQLQAFAASRGEPIWPQVRRELAGQITADGGVCDVQPAGDRDLPGSLRAKVPVPQPDGSSAMGDVVFIGVDGPRWMLRGVLSGRGATDPGAAARLLELYRGVVVVRGTEAFAPTEPLPIRLPEQQPPAAGEPSGSDPRAPLDLSGTGQQITQTH